jgi:ferredoxin-nitrite reductase
MNKFERIKDEKDGLDVWENLVRATTEGHEILDADDRMRLKWYGLYEHNTKDGYFMLRVKVTNGILSADQAEVLAGITRDFGRGIIDCTTRQCVQIHWLRLHEIPELFGRLEAVGMTTSGACGDITRNIVGNTLAGIAADEIVDGHAAAEALHEYFLNNKLYSNLPRKYKISVNGRPTAQGRGLINCISLVGAIHEDGTKGFNVRVGGGLSSAPRMARSIDVFASPEQLPEIMGAVTAVYRDSEENRAKRGKARVKFLVDSIGADGYREKVVEQLGWNPRTAAPLSPESPDHDHIGVTPQKDGVHSSVGLCVRVGRLSADQLFELVELSRKYSTQQEIRLTHQQNVLIPFIENARVDEFLAEPLMEHLQPNPAPFLRNTQSCTGMEYCGLAKIWTKGIVEELVERLDEKFADVDMGQDFRFHYAGCSSSCAQHQIADLGIEGKLKRVDDQMVQAMDVRIGGRTNGNLEPRFNEVILDRVPWWDIEPTLHKVIELYRDNRASREEGFRDFTDRVGFAWWSANLEPAGTPRPADAGAEMLPALV